MSLSTESPIARTPSGAPLLEQHQIDAFWANGFGAVSQLITPEQVAELQPGYDRVIADQRALRLHYEDEADQTIDQVFMPEMLWPDLLQSAYVENGRQLAAQLLGLPVEEVEDGGVMLIAKPAGSGMPAPWHQDEAYWEFPGERLCNSLSVWMPLDPVTVDSGCMQFLPGSHHGDDFLEHRKQGPGKPLELVDEPDTSRAVPCELPAGGATFHHCRTLHHTAANTSGTARRAFTAIYHGPAGVRDVALERPWLAGGPI